MKRKVGEIDFRSRNLIELLHEEKQVVHSWDDVVRALTSNIEYSNDEFLDKLDKSYQFLDKSNFEKEKMNKHAYMIMAHHRPDLLQLLINSLDDERNDIIVHIDKKKAI